MRRSILLLLSLPSVLLAGCGRPVVHETVVERPVVTRESATVVERPAVASAGRSCAYAGTEYTQGTMSCQAGYQYRCNNGTWDSVNVAC
jgi:hypothetical protein